MSLFWLSFVGNDDKWRGGCFVHADTIEEAMTESCRWGCNPGGQVMVVGPCNKAPVPIQINHLYTNKTDIPGGWTGPSSRGKLGT